MGIRTGDIVLVHSSLKSLGWVNGGPVAVIQALLRAVGDDGTIVMPTQSNSLTNPENWEAPFAPKEWLETIRDTMPVFDPRITPTQDMGQVAELFRTWPGAIRSKHPSTSFTAFGLLAEEITSNHSLSDPLGVSSPLGKLYRLGAKVLLIGVDFDKCTALHLAERIVWPDRPKVSEGAPLMIDGERQWVSFEVPRLMDSNAFLPIGASVLRAGLAAVGPLGKGKGILIEMRQLVDHAVTIWSSDRNSIPA
ncbi:aminoglycoside N(3)-acetyltransferase [Edaphobacter albus]|uniref:aminoglycoside N(3)-acetyltransferase n=1 Tax=Edaphobacter sp. 4G125 TaxID=2763071 RepID=UPI001C99F33F|nr:AAC(3) family N-acetyltransferase [Edaphobacter sp. 4G125]